MTFGERLRNWQRAHRWYRARGRAFSVEGKFRAKRGQEVDWQLDENGRPLWIGDGSAAPEPPPDLWDAWEVELAWRDCTERSRWCLKYHMHDKLAPAPACRLILKHARITLRPNSWRDYMREARRELATRLDAGDYRIAA